MCVLSMYSSTKTLYMKQLEVEKISVTRDSLISIHTGHHGLLLDWIPLFLSVEIREPVKGGRLSNDLKVVKSEQTQHCTKFPVVSGHSLWCPKAIATQTSMITIKDVILM